MKLSDQLINDTLRPYISPLASDRCERVRVYVELLLRWNQRMALTTVTDPVQVVAFHFGESFFAAPALGIERGWLIDAGSGAGFPGLALKALLDDLSITLIESNAKKATFLAEAIRSLGLSDAEVFRGRFEDFESLEKAEFVTARALGDFANLLAWSSRCLLPTGRDVLWVGGADADKTSSVSEWNWQPRIQIPLSQNRFLLSGSPIR